MDATPLTIDAVKKDLLEIYGLLYPMLDDFQKRTSEARRASAIADKYDPELPVTRGERQYGFAVRKL